MNRQAVRGVAGKSGPDGKRKKRYVVFRPDPVDPGEVEHFPSRSGPFRLIFAKVELNEYPVDLGLIFC